MELIGIVFVLILVWCIAEALVGGRFSWIAIGIWCLPTIGLAFFAPPGVEVNGLMILLCFFMIIICSCSKTFAKMWSPIKKKVLPLKIGVYIFDLIILLYCFGQAQRLGYLIDLQGLQDGFHFWRYCLVCIPFLLLNRFYTGMVLDFIDRMFTRKSNVGLIQCDTFSTRSPNRRYYFSGIHNGEVYHFRVTVRSYRVLRSMTKGVFEIKKGILGGMYVTKLPVPERKNTEKTKASKVMAAVLWGIIIVLLGVMAGVVYYYFLRG